IRLERLFRALPGNGDEALGGQVKDVAGLALIDDVVDPRLVAHVSLEEGHLALEMVQVLVYLEDRAVDRVAHAGKQVCEVRADEAFAAGDQAVTHGRTADSVVRGAREVRAVKVKMLPRLCKYGLRRVARAVA